MPWSWLDTKYSIHQVQHHPKMNSLPLPASFRLPASFPSLSSLNLGLQLHLQPRSIMASNWKSKLAQLWPRSTSPNSLYHGLQVRLWVHSISASKCITEFTQSRHPSASSNSLDHGLGVYLWVHSVLASKCISEFTRSRPPSASLNSVDHGLQVHHSWVTAGVPRYRGNGGGPSDGEYILGRPWSRQTSTHFRLIWIHAIAWILMAA